MAKGSRPSNGGSERGRTDDALEWYASGEGMWINNYLRGRIPKETLSDAEKQFLSDLDKATNSSLPEQTLYRAVSADAIFGNMSDGTFSDLYNHLRYGNYDKGAYSQRLKASNEARIKSVIGKTITEKGFMSTTSDRQLAHDWGGFTGSTRDIVVELHVPKGTKGANLSNNSRIREHERKNGIQSQKETLLSRNQSYVVNGVYTRDGVIYVKADIRRKK